MADGTFAMDLDADGELDLDIEVDGEACQLSSVSKKVYVCDIFQHLQVLNSNVGTCALQLCILHIVSLL